MLEIAIPIKKSFTQSTIIDLENWFRSLPEGASWYVISDYCFGDNNKKNDVVSFSILLQHDKLENIKEYINAFAPKDLKKTRTVSEGFLKYINSPVIFNISFLINRSSKYMKDYADSENMKNFLPTFRDLVEMIESNSNSENDYFTLVKRRTEKFEKDFKNKSFNSQLSRQIYLVSTFASLIFYYLTIIKKPAHITWISDRDAIIDRYEGIIFDFAYMMYLAEYSETMDTKEGSVLMMDGPKFTFVEPEKSAVNTYDELIRIPDYLAGTLADFDIGKREFSKDKYYQMLAQSLVNSPNHAIIQIDGDSKRLSARRLVFMTG